MREIVEKQADSNLLGNIARNEQNFAIMAYASSGNPRILLKTLSKMTKVNSQEVNTTIREFYRTEIWSEHSQLAEKYLGHRFMIDWGRKFIENHVLPELQKKNAQYLDTERQTSCFFWIHRDTPQPVKEALKLLSYTGIVDEHSSGVKTTRSEIGMRYMVNIGCLLSREANPASTAFPIVKNLTVRRMNEYGHNHRYFRDLVAEVPTFTEPNMSDILQRQLEKSIDVLDITDWQREKLRSLSFNSIGDVLRATEDQLQQAPGIGEKRSRRMRNAAITAVFEYLSG